MSTRKLLPWWQRSTHSMSTWNIQQQAWSLPTGRLRGLHSWSILRWIRTHTTNSRMPRRILLPSRHSSAQASLSIWLPLPRRQRTTRELSIRILPRRGEPSSVQGVPIRVLLRHGGAMLRHQLHAATGMPIRTLLPQRHGVRHTICMPSRNIQQRQ